MKNKITSLTALLVGAVFVLGLGAAGDVHSQAKPTNSKVAAKPLKAAKDALDARKYQDAITKLKEVQGIAGRNAYDDHLVSEMLSYAYLRTNQYGEAVKVLEPMLDSQFVPRSDVPRRVRQLAQIHYQLKNYDKVIALGERAAKGGFADDEMLTWAGQAYYLKGDFKGAARYVDGYISGLVKAGRRPKEQTLQILQSACDKIDDAACLQRTYERLVTYYPKPIYWQNLVDAMYRDPGSDQGLLQVFRLAAAVDVLKRPKDFTEYAQLALEAGSAAEAQAILEKGFAKKVFTEPRDADRNKRLLENAKKRAAAEQAGLASQANAAAAGTEGVQDVRVGLAYLGHKQYDKAVEALNRAVSKTGQKTPANANARLLLGIAELQAGRKEEARKAFRQVKGDPTLERLANLWTLHSQA